MTTYSVNLSRVGQQGATGPTGALVVDTVSGDLYVDGSLGVGTNSPESQLDVFGGIRSTSAGGYSQIVTTSIGDTVVSNDGVNWLTVKAGAPIDTMRIDSSGNVGIGTSSPASELEVFGVGDIIRITANDATSNFMAFYDTTGRKGFFGYGDATEDMTFANERSGYLRFQTDDAERMRIDSSGNVGIGTSSPESILHLASTDGGGSDIWEGRLLTLSSFSPGVFFKDNSVNAQKFLITNDSDALIINSTPNDNGTSLSQIITLSHTGNLGIHDPTPDVALDVVGDINYTGTITDVSDRRLKENVQDLSDSLDKICQLDAKSYTLIADRGNESTTVELGFIAQEVQPVFPEIVKEVQKFAVDENGEDTTEEVNYLGVSYIQLIAPMVEAIKELKLKNDTLEARITDLEVS